MVVGVTVNDELGAAIEKGASLRACLAKVISADQNCLLIQFIIARSYRFLNIKIIPPSRAFGVEKGG